MANEASSSSSKDNKSGDLEDVLHKFRRLSYFDQHAVTRQCGAAALEMLAQFASGNAEANSE